MKQGWKTAKFKDVSTVVGGSTPKTDIPEYWGGDNYWVAPAELDGSKFISSTVKRITDLAISKTNLTLLPQGTVLLSSRAPIGKVAITTVPMYCNQGFKNIVCGPELFNGYVYYFLKHNVDYLQSLSTGATFKEISKKVVENVSISYPSLAEQRHIVNELDLLSGIIDKKKAQLRDLDALSQSIFYEMFGDPVLNDKGWKVKLLKEIANVKIGPFGSLLHATDYITGGCPVINPVHMRAGHIIADKDFSVDDDKRKEMSSYFLEPNDIIFGRRGDIGRCAIVSAKEAGYICGTGSLFVRFKTSFIVPFFALSLFMTNEMRDLLVGQAKGATMLNINCGIVENLPVILPPLDLQHAFAAKIEAIEQQNVLIKNSLHEAQTLLASRMDRYFGD